MGSEREELRSRLKARGRYDLPIERVDFAGVPGWEDETGVYVQMLTAGQRNQYDDSLSRYTKEGEWEPVREDHDEKLVILAACTASGERIYSDADLPWLRMLGHLACRRMYEAAARLSRMGYVEKNPQGRTAAAAEPLPAGAGDGAE